MKFGELVVGEDGGSVDVKEWDVEANEEGKASPTPSLAILTMKVVSREVRRRAVTLPQLCLLQTTHPDVIAAEETAKFHRRVSETISVPLHDDEG